MTKTTYTITVGEVGNEQGHAITSKHVSDEAAIAKARKEVAPYNGDGWFTVTDDDTGQIIAKGGRRNF